MNYTIYIYHDGFDLHEIVDRLSQEVKKLVGQIPSILFVDNLFPKDEDMDEDDLPQWDFGVNFDIHSVNNQNLEYILSTFQTLADQTQRDFAVGYVNQNDLSEDIGFIRPSRSNKDILAILKELK